MANVTTTGWTSEPDGRGTFGILKSCVATLVLCVYTALHINIPHGGTSSTRKYLIKAKWVLLGMFAPELVVFFAWSQNQHARAFSQDLKAVFAKLESEDPQNKRLHQWTLMHGFYAVMGGFAVETNVAGEEPYIPGSPRLTLQDKLILQVAELGLLPDISRGHIKDKSKADSLAKALVIVQASWLILQIIMRWTQKLPVSPLELNTLAHAVCALIVYALWWEKPLDVEEPTIVEGEGIPSLVAFNWELGVVRAFKERKFRRIGDKDLPKALGYENFTNFQVQKTVLRASRQGPDWAQQRVSRVERVREGLVAVVPSGFSNGELTAIPSLVFRDGKVEQEVFVLCRRQYPAATDWEPLEVIHPVQGGAPLAVGHRNSSIDAIARRRWELLFQLIIELPECVRVGYVRFDRWDVQETNGLLNAGPSLPRYMTVLTSIRGIQSDNAFVSLEIPNANTWVIDDATARKSVVSFAFFCSCALAYGGVHASAWNDFFPSQVEQLLWRISALFVAAFGIISVLYVIMLSVLKNAELFETGVNEKYAESQLVLLLCEWVFKAIKLFKTTLEYFVGSIYVWRTGIWRAFLALCAYGTVGIFLCGVLFYFLCRGYLVVEAFVSLRQLPVETYSTPSWPQYLPHL